MSPPAVFFAAAVVCERRVFENLGRPNAVAGSPALGACERACPERSERDARAPGGARAVSEMRNAIDDARIGSIFKG